MSEIHPDEVMTVKEVADYLKIAKSTVYRLVKNGSLPGRKLGGNWRFSRKGLEIWLGEWPWPHPKNSISRPDYIQDDTRSF